MLRVANTTPRDWCLGGKVIASLLCKQPNLADKKNEGMKINIIIKVTIGAFSFELNSSATSIKKKKFLFIYFFW